MNRLVLLLIVVLIVSSRTHRLRGEEPAAESLLDFKLVAEEGTGVARLKKAKYNCAVRGFESRHALWRGGKASLADLISAAERLRLSDLDNSKKRLLAHLRFAQELEAHVDAKVKGGICNPADFELARYHRLDLEIRLLED